METVFKVTKIRSTLNTTDNYIVSQNVMKLPFLTRFIEGDEDL